ncbi:unnamed protein product [Ascophyllum nodosum]|jgi:uncharacterized protein YggT (Ycf19 family)|uniref:Conserved hypothetical plastid protein n=2 Tax=Fucus TaxID=3011 RepID=A0A2R4QPX8_9PHAE|nr:conserved hypothetical plastid protein [Fucus vesiculosus]YP_010317787.1 hypothetical protein Ycf19 [Silvetia siliquosa]AVZ00619.1 conserved hypothetical plastid protein [Fucus spiralis]UNH90224.1 hypothetical protein Ycf19 [Silvetia siliquosa]CAX12484.1 conserved hypothetical plastid protein [Fucus vesiculosus]
MENIFKLALEVQLFESPPPFDPSDFAIKDILNLIIYFMKVFLRQYYWVLTLRLSIQWFPNINPYIHPMYTLIFATEFFLKQFKDLLPIILGMDMSAMCAFLCLEWMIRTLESIKFT